MKLKPGARAVVLNAPEGFLKDFMPLPEGVHFEDRLEGKFDWVQVFVYNQAQLDILVPELVNALNPESLLWICFPKGSSKIQTDLTRDMGWDSLKQSDLKWVNLISVDPTWSAFYLRPFKPGEPHQTWW
jgi:hypothetical protein